MRNLAIVVAGLCFGVSSSARADQTAVELQARGEQLAKDGRYTEAVDAFKQADHLEERASHACLIALAYTRRELWSQAEIWLDACHKRVKPGDELPEWSTELEKQIDERLAAATVAPIDIVVEPGEAKVTVSSFAPDESFAPRTIHLPPGHHVIIAKSPGYRDGQRAIDVTDRTPQHIAIKLEPAGASEITHAPRPGKTLMLAGGVLAVIGVATYAWMSVEYFGLKNATVISDYSSHSTQYTIAKYSTLGLWTVGGALLVTGYLLHRSSDESPTVAAAPIPGGAMVAVGWQR